jgi:hypothetical protein
LGRTRACHEEPTFLISLLTLIDCSLVTTLLDVASYELLTGSIIYATFSGCIPGINAVVLAKLWLHPSILTELHHVT